MGQIAMLDRIEYEYEYRDAEYEYEKKHEQCGARSKPQSVGINASGCTK
jgi:hypothetical protein